MIAMSTPTQVQHPARASVRTFFQTLIPALAFFVVAIPPFVDIVLDEVGKAGVTLPGWAYAVLSGASVVCALIAATVARVMAIPGVEERLERIGFGAKPQPTLAEYNAEIAAASAEADDGPKH